MLKRFLGLSASRLASRRANRRVERRYDAPGAVLVAKGHRFPLVDVSLEGLRAGHVPHVFRPGERVAFALELPMSVRRLDVHGEGEVLRVDRDCFALRYMGLDQRLMRLLDYYLGSRRMAH